MFNQLLSTWHALKSCFWKPLRMKLMTVSRLISLLWGWNIKLNGKCTNFFVNLAFLCFLKHNLRIDVFWMLFSTRRGRPWWYCFCWNCMSPEKITPFVLKNKRYFLSVIKTFRLFLENLRSAMLTLVLVTFS